MTGLLTFQTKHGPITVEIDDGPEGASQDTGVPEKFTRKGYTAGRDPEPKRPPDMPRSFDTAMASLKAYAANLDDLVQSLNLMPTEVSVEIALKFVGSAGFVIAKAGAETSIKVGLTWEPASKPRQEPDVKV